MKRVAAILLLGILCFNWCGYRLLTAYMESRSDRQLEARLNDNQYDESQLLSIKVASHLSYSNPSLQFERVDGQVEVGGVIYKYVKRRIFNDSLELMCIPNHAAMNLQTAKNEFFQLVNDLRHNGQDNNSNSHHGNSKSPVSPEYLTIDGITIGSPSFISKAPALYQGICLLSTDPSPAEQPPDPSFLLA